VNLIDRPAEGTDVNGSGSSIASLHRVDCRSSAAMSCLEWSRRGCHRHLAARRYRV